MKTWKIDFMPDLTHVRISIKREMRVGSYFDYIGTFASEKAALYLLIETVDEDVASKLADRFASHYLSWKEPAQTGTIIDNAEIVSWIGKQLAAMA